MHEDTRGFAAHLNPLQSWEDTTSAPTQQHHAEAPAILDASQGPLRTHAQCQKREKTKMADVGGRVNVNSERAVCKIHEALKGKIHELAGKKAWSSEQKEDFEKRLTEVRWFSSNVR